RAIKPTNRTRARHQRLTIAPTFFEQAKRHLSRKAANIDRLMFARSQCRVLKGRDLRHSLARGLFFTTLTGGISMLLEQRTYDIDPGVPMQEFLQNYEQLGLPAQKEILEGFVGYFTTEFGTQNLVHHVWASEDLEERRRRRAALVQDPRWQECISIVRPMIIRWNNVIMYPTSFSPMRSLPIQPLDDMTAFNFMQGK